MADRSRKRSRKLPKKYETFTCTLPVRVSSHSSGSTVVGDRAEIIDLQKQLSTLKNDFDAVVIEKTYLQEKLATIVKKIFQNIQLSESTKLMVDANENKMDQFPLSIILEALSTLITGKQAIEKDSLATRLEELETRVTQQAQTIETLVADRPPPKNEPSHFNSGEAMTEVVLYAYPDGASGHLVASEHLVVPENIFVANLHDYAIPLAINDNESEEVLDPPHQPATPVQSDGNGSVTYTVYSGSSKRGKDILIDSLGYRYTKKVDKRRVNPGWRCSARNGKITCQAAVIERNGQYQRSGQGHSCICKDVATDASDETVSVNSQEQTEQEDVSESDDDQDQLTVIHQLDKADEPLGTSSTQELQPYKNKPVTESLNVVVEQMNQRSLPLVQQPLVQPEWNGSTTYTVITNSSAFGKDVLIDSLGYRYTRKVDKRRKQRSWRCTYRSSKVMCRATVLERNERYERGLYEHECGSAQPGRDKMAIISRDAKIAVTKRPFDSATEIVKEIMMENLNSDDLFPPYSPTLPKVQNIIRQVAKKQRKLLKSASGKIS